VFYRSTNDIQSVLSTILDLPADNIGLILRDLLLIKIGSQLTDESASQSIVATVNLVDSIVEHALHFVIEEAYKAIKEVQTASVEQLEKITSVTPQASPCLIFVSSVVSSLLKRIVLSSSDEQTTVEMQTVVDYILHLAKIMFAGCCQVLNVVLEVCDAINSRESAQREVSLSALERVAKGTALGHLLPVLVCCLNHPSLKSLSLAENLVSHLVLLTVLTSKAALLLKGKFKSVALRQDSVETITQTGLAAKEDVSSQPFDSQEVGYLSSLVIPSPWTAGRSVETIHPVRDNYKFKETVRIPGARNLFLKFDPRCASQYDYDKVVVHAGPATNGKKVAEYGGNTYGFGSRSVLGAGWPKDPVKVEGDTVTFSFEMRSGREHNTPDRACWGFACTVRAQETLDEGEGTGLPFMADLALSLSVLSCSLIQILYDGPAQSTDEESCQDMFEHQLMHRCIWSSSEISEQFVVGDENLLSSEEVKELRILSGKVTPPLRPRIEKIIQQERVERFLVSAVFKQLKLLPQVAEGKKESACAICTYLFTKIDALIRQLASICETEMNWLHAVSDVTQGVLQPVDTFFIHYAELGKVRELQLLCDIVNVEANPLDWFETVRQLTEELGKQSAQKCGSQSEDVAVDIDSKLSKTKYIVQMMIEKAELLLHIMLSLPDLRKADDHSISSKQSEQGLTYMRSVSAPSELSTKRLELKEGIQELLKLRQWQSGYKKKKQTSAFQLSTEIEFTGSTLQQQFINELLSFISDGEGQVGLTSKFLSAAKLRHNRGQSRCQALKYMKELMDAACEAGGATQLVSYIAPVLAQGPRAGELSCGGLDSAAQSGYEDALAAVVSLARQQPITCLNSIGLLCVIPYGKAEEACLVGSGLLQLLDVLCCPKAVTGDREVQHKVGAIAWAGFRVVADRCVSWEEKDQDQTVTGESGLAYQVSNLLSNHLARVSHGHPEALHNALAYLHSLSQRSNMGKAIISQPACIARLLSLLVEQRPTPKLVQVVLQLCSVALPLMSVNDSEAVPLPAFHQLSRDGTSLSGAAQIVHLLISKLGDFVMPMFSSTSRASSVSQNLSSSRIEMPTDEGERDDEMDRVSVFIHKRQDQSAHEVIQPLLSSDSRPFRLGGAANMDRVMKMDRTMNVTGRAEAITDDRRLCLRKAARWAQVGFVVSIGPPADGVTSAANADDRKKRMAEEVCRDRNEELAVEDCTRPFISGHVANSMASDIIAVLHSLLSSKESKIWHVWSNAIRNVLLSALDSIPNLVSSLACHASMEESTEAPGDIMVSAKSALAALCSLGGFKESLRPGCSVQIKGGAGEPTRAEILSISDHEGVATVCLHNDTISYHPKNTLQVPLCCLVPPSSETLPLGQLDVTNQVVKAVECLLTSALPSSLMIPTEGVESALSVDALACARLLGELRTRACMLLSQHVMEPSFAQAFLETAHQPLKTLCELANRCSPGERLPAVEQLCEKLRMLYRDCSRPAAPLPAPKPREVKQITFDLNRSFPQPRFCILCNNYKDVTFVGDSGPASTGHPRGVLLFATTPIEPSASAFYWEVEMVHLSDNVEDDSIQFSLGFMPNVESAKESWNPPEGSCLLHSTGRAYVYGSGVLDRRSFSFDIRMKTGDVLGMGWMRQAGTPSVGNVFITLNGNKLEGEIDDVQANLWPIVHLQKKNGRIKANFGSSSFVYEEGQQLASSSERDPIEEVQSTFKVLPFPSASDTDSDSGAGARNTAASAQIPHIPAIRPSSPIATIGYEASASSRYELPLSYDNMISSGPPVRAGAGQPPEMVFQEEDEKEKSGGGHEDLHGLLVKAWETKVFPVIKRRFRNESERKSGLEQIKGALQLGMADIARQTVEFLYEENGGIPRDLHLPTLVEVKADMEKFTIGRLHKGMPVGIQALDNSGSLPKFGVVNMLKTFGLIGTVLDVDKSLELVQVETYLETEGSLVHYWYPVSALEKPPKGHQHAQKNLTAASIDNLTFHRVLLQSEVKLSCLYCRMALLSLVNYSKPSDVLSDVDQLRLLSYHLLSCPQPDGTAQLNSLNTAPSSEQCLRSISCSPLTVFFASGEKHMATKLYSVIGKSSSSGKLAELCSCLCNVLQLAPKAFQHVELKFTENSNSTDVCLPGAAAIVVACQTNGKGPSELKGPWARLLVYKGASEGGQHLQTERLEIMRYPNDSMSMPSSKVASSMVYCGDRFPSFILPCDHLHVAMTPCPGLKACLRFHAVPPDLPVALAFVVILVDNFDELIETGDKDQLAQSLTYCAESLCKLLYRSELAIIVKELLFHVLASILRLFCSESCLKPYVGNLKFCQQKLASTVGELKELAENETGSKSAEKKNLDLRTNRLSTYCQCLFEFVAALWFVFCETRELQEQTPEYTSEAPVAAAVVSPPLSKPARSGKEKTPNKGGSGVKKRKSLKKKAAAKKPTGDIPTSSIAESTNGNKSGKKTEPKTEGDSHPEWLRNALSALTALQCVTSQQRWSSNALKEMLNKGSKCASTVLTSHRLLVIQGLPETVDADEVASIISHICSTHGGLFRGELYLPSVMRMCEVEEEVGRTSMSHQGIDNSADNQSEGKLSDSAATLVSQVEELRNMVSSVDSDVEQRHLSLQEVLSEAHNALSSAIGDRMTRHLVEQALGSLVADSESDGENDDVQEQFGSESVSGFFAEALAQELAIDSAVESDNLYVESDNLYVDLDLDQADDRDNTHDEVQVDGIQSENDALVEEKQSSQVQNTVKEETFSDQQPEQKTELRKCCQGVAVLEVRCAAKLSAIRAALLDCSQLTRQGAKKLVIQSVNESLHCEDEELQAVLWQYLLNKLIQEGKLTQQAHVALGALFKSCIGKDGPPVLSRNEAMANEKIAKLISCCQPAEEANNLFGVQDRAINEVHFLDWLTRQCIANPVQVWGALISSGYDLQLNW
jgi:E3 ubiquitin-protein ligase HECTD4